MILYIKLTIKNIYYHRCLLNLDMLNFRKAGESNIFVSTKKLEYYGTLQVKQKYQ